MKYILIASIILFSRNIYAQDTRVENISEPSEYFDVIFNSPAIAVGFNAHATNINGQTVVNKVYYSKDTIVDASDELIQTFTSTTDFDAARGVSLYLCTGSTPNRRYLGTGYIISVIDPDDQISEINEDNNAIFTRVSVGTITCPVATSALFASVFSFQFSISVPNNLDMEWNIVNNTLNDYSFLTIDYYLSEDNTLNPNEDSLITNSFMSFFPLLSSETHFEIQTVYLDNTIRSGNYFLFIEAFDEFGLKLAIDPIPIAIENSIELSTHTNDQQNELNFYPNPTKDKLHLHESINWSIVTLQGKEVKKGYGA